MTRYFITGVSGNLGRPLSKLAAAMAETIGTYYRNPAVGGGDAVGIDLRDSTAVMSRVRDRRPSVIIHAAGSERSDDMANTNKTGAVNICRAAQQIGVRLIALSSDIVFDGSAPPYSEEFPLPRSPLIVVSKPQTKESSPDNTASVWWSAAASSAISIRRITRFSGCERKSIDTRASPCSSMRSGSQSGPGTWPRYYLSLLTAQRRTS